MRRFYDYQIPVYKYAQERQHPALLLEMRLGKNIIAIRTCKQYTPIDGIKIRVLVLTPFSAFRDWCEDLKLENQDFVILAGTRQKKQKLLLEGDVSWYLGNHQIYMPIPFIGTHPFDAVILDESTCIKNPKARVTKIFCSMFRGVPHRFILAGLANPESELDYFCQYKFLDGGETFGMSNFYEFRMKYFSPVGFGGYHWKITERGKHFITKKVAETAYTLQRKDVKTMHGGVKVYKTRVVRLPIKLKQEYDKIKKTFMVEHTGQLKRTKYAMAVFQWLRSLCNGFIFDNTVFDGKVAELKYLLDTELKGQQFLVYCQDYAEMQLIYNNLNKKYRTEMFAGDLKINRMIDVQDKFQKGRTQVLICQNDSTTFGANLSAASVVFYYSAPLGNLTRVQTEDRAILPTKKEATLIIDCFVEDTVDEDIYTALKNKKEKSQIINEIIKEIQSGQSATKKLV